MIYDVAFVAHRVTTFISFYSILWSFRVCLSSVVVDCIDAALNAKTRPETNNRTCMQIVNCIFRSFRQQSRLLNYKVKECFSNAHYLQKKRSMSFAANSDRNEQTPSTSSNTLHGILKHHLHHPTPQTDQSHSVFNWMWFLPLKPLGQIRSHVSWSSSVLSLFAHSLAAPLILWNLFRTIGGNVITSSSPSIQIIIILWSIPCSMSSASNYYFRWINEITISIGRQRQMNSSIQIRLARGLLGSVKIWVVRWGAYLYELFTLFMRTWSDRPPPTGHVSAQRIIQSSKDRHCVAEWVGRKGVWANTLAKNSDNGQ